MKRSTKWIGFLMSAALLAATGRSFLAQQTVTQPVKDEVALRAAMEKETVQGDLKGAIEQYKKLSQSKDRSIAAKALIRMAQLYQKLGDDESRKIYQRVLREYVDQPDAVATAVAQLKGNGTTQNARVTTRQVWTGPQISYSAAVSPDGRLMSFVDQTTGNLALHDLSNGKDRPITNKTGWTESNEYAERSTFSPDGKRVVYAWFNKVGLYDLRVASIDSMRSATQRILYANEDVYWISPEDWSLDGKWIAVRLTRKDRVEQLALVNAADGSMRVLKSVGWGTSSRMYFSPDARYLAMSFPDQEGSTHRDVFVMTTDGSREIPVVVHPANDQAVGWTPDGKHLLFSSDRTGPVAIYAIAFEDGKPRGNPRKIQPDIGQGQTIGMTRSGLLYFGLLSGGRDLSIASVDFQSGRLIKAATAAVHQFIGSNYQPDWSPDGRYLSYASSARRDSLVLKIQDTKTGDTRELAPHLRSFNVTRWSPDGRSFIAQGTDLKGRQGIYRIDAQTGEIEAITLSGPEESSQIPQWAPDRTKIYFKRGDLAGKNDSLLERDMATGNERELLRQTTLNGFSLSPDGKQVVYDTTDPATKETAVSILTIDRKEPRNLLRPNSGFSNPYWMPNGSFILLLKSGEIWAVSPAGGEPRKIELGVNRISYIRVNPDGRQIVFLARNDTPQEVWVMENLLSTLVASK